MGAEPGGELLLQCRDLLLKQPSMATKAPTTPP
jgi:hypothetical protein